MTEQIQVPDPIVGKPKHKKITFRKEAIIIFLLGLLAGWFWMTWAMYLEPPLGLDGFSFWRLLLPF